MPYRIDDYSRIRMEVDIVAKTGPVVEVLNGGQCIFGRGSKLRFEFLLKAGEEIADPSLISVAHLRVLSSEDPDSAIAIDKTIGPSAMNAGVTQAQWDAGDPAMAHFRFELSSSETAEGVFAGTMADAGQKHWFLLTHGAGDDLLFAGVIQSFDFGSNAAGTPPLSGTAATLEQVSAVINAALQNVVKFTGNAAGKTIELTSPTTNLKVQLGADDAGNFSTGTQPTD